MSDTYNLRSGQYYQRSFSSAKKGRATPSYLRTGSSEKVHLPPINLNTYRNNNKDIIISKMTPDRD